MESEVPLPWLRSVGQPAPRPQDARDGLRPLWITAGLTNKLASLPQPRLIRLSPPERNSSTRMGGRWGVEGQFDRFGSR